VEAQLAREVLSRLKQDSNDVRIAARDALAATLENAEVRQPQPPRQQSKN
jgi:hypothetical protein